MSDCPVKNRTERMAHKGRADPLPKSNKSGIKMNEAMIYDHDDP